ncbi:MAG: SDR family oxidoreductase [Chloroflexi bacterium]|nr:SDR family oxidoreductase [Chloroflexota bacterium]
MLILIVGASGFLGSRLFSDLRTNNEVVGSYLSRPSPDLIRLDVSDRDRVQKLLETTRIDLIIDCGGMTRPDACESNPQRAYSVNVEGAKNLADFACCKIIYFSTDYVFDGSKESYTENDEPHPINVYGKTKLDAEKIILRDPKNIVVRVSGLYGFSQRNNEFLLSLSNPVIYKAIDCYASSILLDDIVDNWPFLVSASGLYHMTDGRRLSRFEFASKAVRVLGINSKVIAKTSDELHRIARRPKESALVTIRHNLLIRNEDDGLMELKSKMKG